MAASKPKFRSKFEARVYAEAVASGHALTYEPADLRLSYVCPGIYTPDFRLPNGIIIETKGLLTYEDRRKMVAVKAANPKLDIRMVFMRADNLIRRGSKMTYSLWAEKYGFPWAEGVIPDKWFKEKRKC